MEDLKKFFDGQGQEGDLLNLSGGSILEFTRARIGLYVRIVEREQNRFNLFIFQNGGNFPKTKFYQWYEKDGRWHNDNCEHYGSVSSEEVCDKVREALK